MKVLVIILIFFQVFLLSLIFAPTKTDSPEYAESIVNQIENPNYNNYTNYLYHKTQMHKIRKMESVIIIAMNLLNAFLITIVFFKIFKPNKKESYHEVKFDEFLNSLLIMKRQQNETENINTKLFNCIDFSGMQYANPKVK